MRGKDTYNVNDLKQYLFGELKQMLDAQVINYTAEQLHANPEIKDEFELAIQDELRISLERAGMGFDRLRLLSCYHEQMDKTRKIREKYFLMVSEQQAGNEGIKRLFDEKNSAELEEIRQLGIKADNHEQRIEAFAKWRKFVNADEMNKLKTVDDLEAHEHKLGIGKRERDVLGEDQIDVLRRSLEMEGEEKAIVHRHFKQRLESEHQIAQKRYEAIEMLKLGLEVDESKVDHTLTQQKKMLDAKLDAELKQYQQDKIKRDDSLKEWEKVEEIKRKKEEEKRRISREDDLMRDQAVHELKMEELEKMSEASAEALIAMADSDKAILLADLQKTEALKGMSEDQILAMASENSPEVAKAFQEKFKAIASKEYHQEKDVMNKDMMDRMHEMFNKALETQRDTASSFAHGQGVNVAYPPAGGQPVVANAGGIVGGVILCPSCRRQVPQDAMFCDNCGKKIRE
jgi:hypothetical protein